MLTRFPLAACLASFVALIAGREDAAATYRVDPATRASAVLYTDGFIIRMAQDDSAASTNQAPDSPPAQDDAGASANPPPQDPQ
jgi:hypothetical protein